MSTLNPLPPKSPTLVRGIYPENSTTGQLANNENILLSGAEAAFANNPQFIGQVTLEEHHDDEMEIVDHPIQQGANITDHAFKRPAELTLRIGWAGAQLVAGGFVIVGAGSFTGQADTYLQQLAAIYQQLLLGQANSVLYTIVTGKRQYTQMMFKRIITQSDKENENVLALTIHAKQIFIVDTNPTSVPAAQYALLNPGANYPTQQQGRASLVSAPTINLAAASAAIGK